MKMLNRALALVFFLVLSACGGGGGSAGTPVLGGGAGTGSGTTTPGGTTTAVAAGTVSVSISSTSLTASTPATVTATVRSASGGTLAGQVVSFASTGSLGAFTPATALTDSSGNATTQLSPASSTANGADLVVATTTIGTSAVTGTIGFQIIGAGKAASGNPTLVIALTSTNVSIAAPASLTGAVTDSAGVAIAGQVVKFSSIDGLGLFTPNSALTDSAGRFSVKLAPTNSTTNGADLAVAQTTVNGTQLSATVGFSALATTAGSGTPTISLALSTVTVTTATPATVIAVVRDALGVGVPSQVVKFKTVDGLGTFTVASALTNSSGSATVSLTAANASASGADQVVATTTLGTASLQASQGFQLTASNVTIASFTSDVGSGILSAYGQSNLVVTLAGGTSGGASNVTLTSTCVAKGKATLTPATVATTTGTASFTYRDNGCGATDTADSLQASLVGSANVTPLAVKLSAPTVSSISFVSAAPQTIFLKASGYQENATVLFRVLDGSGNGLPNVNVDLAASTLSGGLTIDGGSGSVTKRSDSLGNVSVLVNSGTVPTPVRIKATLSGGTIATVSSNLSIAVGRPSQLNFSLSQQAMNIEGGNLDGTPNTYSIIASDRLGNPVPAGTAINFVAEGGSIEPSKFTTLTSGFARASANFVSSEPRPADGRVTIVAYALGEESFLDTNGNNVWDAGEPVQDLGNIFIDRPFTGIFDSSLDQFIPLSIPNVSASQTCVTATSPLLALDKSIPSVGGTCDGTWGQAYVRRAVETVFSTSAARPLWAGTPSGLATLDGSSCVRNVGPLVTSYNGAGQSTSLSFLGVDGRTGIFNAPASGSFAIIVGDANGIRLNPMAAGTVVSVSGTPAFTTGSGSITVSGSPVPSTLSASTATVSYIFGSPAPTSGTITVTFASPSGLGTSVAIPITQAAPASSSGNCP